MKNWLKSLHAGQVVLLEVVVVIAVPVLMYVAAKTIEDEVLGARVWAGIWATALVVLVALPWGWFSNRRPQG